MELNNNKSNALNHFMYGSIMLNHKDKDNKN